jgi:hypothetical protein
MSVLVARTDARFCRCHGPRAAKFDSFTDIQFDGVYIYVNDLRDVVTALSILSMPDLRSGSAHDTSGPAS